MVEAPVCGHKSSYFKSFAQSYDPNAPLNRAFRASTHKDIFFKWCQDNMGEKPSDNDMEEHISHRGEKLVNIFATLRTELLGGVY
jgi:hypothetical protein